MRKMTGSLRRKGCNIDTNPSDGTLHIGPILALWSIFGPVLLYAHLYMGYTMPKLSPKKPQLWEEWHGLWEMRPKHV